MDHPRQEWRLDVDDELRVTTPASIWLIRPACYCRLPRHAEQPRHALSDALVDAQWHEHVGAWLVIDPVDRLPHIRLLPAGRPPGSYGIFTGAVDLPDLVAAAGVSIPAELLAGPAAD